MRPWSAEYAGRIEERELHSSALEGNRLGDPASRPIWIYLPPGYDDDPGRRYPVIYFLHPFGGMVTRWGNRPTFHPSVPELLDGCFAAGDAPACIVAYVDGWTSLGGGQFVDSPATGRYHTYLCEDVVGYVDANFRTLPGPGHRALQGKSSGGFGAAVNAMLRPDVFGAFASHAGDAGYELCYLREIADAYRALRDRYDGSYDAFFAEFHACQPVSRREDGALVMVYAMAACFSADEDGTVRLPFDTRTGAVVAEVWERWLAWDPIRMVARHREALASLGGIWIDAGRADDFYFDVSGRLLVEELRRNGIDDVVFELFDGTHSGTDHRYPLAAAYLARRISRP